MVIGVVNLDGAAKSPPYYLTVVFQDLDLPDVGLRPRKTTRPCRTKFLLSHLRIFCEYIILYEYLSFYGHVWLTPDK